MDKFFHKYHKLVLGYVIKRIGVEEDAEELANTVLLAAWNSLSSYSGKASEKNWVMGITRHKIVDYFRKKKLKTVLFSTVPYLEEIADKSIGPEGDSLKDELKTEIKEVLGKLSEGYSKILRLKYIDGHKIAKIAKVMGLSYKAIESRLGRAKAKFRQIYEEKNS